MTSKNSFWDSSKENHKRRIWVWIVTVMVQLMMYVGVLTVYLSRIRRWNAEGIYRTVEEYKNALYQATKDALGFQDNLMFPLIVLAAIIGVQGFSYLYDRRKIDMYHSVPVDKNKRFAVVYVNGIIMYLVSTLASLLIGTVMAAAQGAVNGEAMAVIGLGFIWNLLFFLVMYHTVILAVMITGNRFVTVCVAGGLAIYEAAIYNFVENLQYSFFETVSGFYVTHNPKLSALYDYFGKTWELKRADGVQELAKGMLPYCGKWFILAVVILAVAWWCYRKRPSEAAGKAVAFVRIEPFMKVAAAIPLGLSVGLWVHNAAYENTMLTAVSMIGGCFVVCAVMEVIYDFDIRSLFKHLVSSGIAVAGIVFVFLIFKMDLFGYDDYIPASDKVDSAAVSVDYYGSFWDEDYDYVDPAEFSEKHMYLTDVEPILKLADKARVENVEDMTDPRTINVLYRLNSGRRVGRRFFVDFANAGSEELMNRIVGTREFKEGTYQILTDEDSFTDVLSMTYSNGAAKVALPAEEVQMLREAYIKDMENFDFSLAVNNHPCGRISMNFPEWFNISLNVYDSFDNTIAYLDSKEAYYPVELNPEDIADITITNYHYELQQDGNYDDMIDPLAYDSAVTAQATRVADSVYEGDLSVTETFTNEEDIAQIVPNIYPEYMSGSWNHESDLDNNYDIYITFKKDTTYPYDRSQFGVYYKFYTGQDPDFVKEATAFVAGEQ